MLGYGDVKVPSEHLQDKELMSVMVLWCWERVLTFWGEENV